MESIKNVVEEALNGFFTPVVVSDIATKISEKAAERQLILMEERFCIWNDFKKKKPDVWVSKTEVPIEFAIRRIGMIDSELAHFDGKRFYWIEKGYRFYYQAVTHWVQMPRLLGWEDYDVCSKM
ncbi:MAG: hypothetical protein J6D26_07125 [Clostridia bacterium]|nr:hypothetical protein [Clostridia bacterium]